MFCSFTDTDSLLTPAMCNAIARAGYLTPTPIQAKTIEPILEGRDVIGCAQTGTGKTAAFAIPMLERLTRAESPLAQRTGAGPRALVLAPTRELALQIAETFVMLGGGQGIRTLVLIGGDSMGPQLSGLQKRPDVIVATPGRLADHLERRSLSLGAVRIVVLDEADRMLDMGFAPQVERILRVTPLDRQTLFFSATLPPPIVQLSREMLKNPFTVNIERAAAPAVGITQAVYPVPQNLKAPLLEALLKRGDIDSALVFTRTKHRANRLAESLTKHGVRCERIHGNRTQAQRTQALAGFKEGRFKVLVATDIAARGIDVEALSHVVNFDVPHVPEDYIHRVGRTARAEMTGDAYTFVSPEEEGDLRAIERAIGKRLPRITVPGFDYAKAPAERFEVPIAERIAAIRARKAQERTRAREKAERRIIAQRSSPPRHGNPQAHGRPGESRGQGPKQGTPPAPRWGRRG